MTRRDHVLNAVGTALVCVLLAVFLNRYWWA